MSFDPTTCTATALSPSSDDDMSSLDPTRQSVALAAYDVLCRSLYRGTDNYEELVVRGNSVHALLYLCDLGLLAVGINPDSGMRVEA